MSGGAFVPPPLPHRAPPPFGAARRTGTPKLQLLHDLTAARRGVPICAAAWRRLKARGFAAADASGPFLTGRGRRFADDLIAARASVDQARADEFALFDRCNPVPD